MSNSTYPIDPVLSTTVEHVNIQENRSRNNKIKILQSMAGIQIVTGIICSAMGGTAMVLECYLSRIGDPIWSGLLFFLVAGIAGSAGTATGKQCGITFYAVWSSLSAACAAQLFGFSVYAASQELEFLCYPGIDYYKVCTYVIEARVGINVCISIISFIALIACLTASCMSCALPAPQTTRIIVQATPAAAATMESAPTSYPNPNAQYVPMDSSKPYGTVEPPPYSAN
ncbi:uncharacterized protein LOC129258224 isoform X2 [Lytechinus pictus]|uniref:uncharacterized protein LOC129258224 isoform X2 n=1 Tax=Lytechinus pictus TaxID=7653 RepID=UPI0030B9D448